jgi:kinesin family protein 15
MLPRNPIARDTAELPSSSSPSSSAKTRPSSRKHKPSKENDPPSDHNIIVPYSPSHVKSKSPLPPTPPSSKPLKRKLALDTIAAENSLPATTDSGVKVFLIHLGFLDLVNLLSGFLFCICMCCVGYCEDEAVAEG